jgi:hypothetical protein
VTRQTVSAGAAHTASAAGSDGFPLVAVLDTSNDDLRVVHCADATCSASTGTTLDSAGNVGRYPSVTVGTDGLGLVSYLDTTSRQLPPRQRQPHRGLHCPNVFCVPYLRRR